MNRVFLLTATLLAAQAMADGSCPSAATHCTGPRAAVHELVIVMDDLGYNLQRAERVLALPGAVVLGLLPFAPNSAAIARRAAETGHETLLHQPMEPLRGPAVRAMPGTLTLDMSAERFEAEIEAAFRAVPGIIGVNNHTGSRLTQDPESMRRLMRHLAARDLLFLDSRTTAATVAYSMAREARVPALQRDVFLDHEPHPQAIAAAFQRALTIARQQGHAVIIAHPHDTSLTFLEDALARLPSGFELVALRELARRSHLEALAAPATLLGPTAVSRRGALLDPATLARRENPATPHRSPGR